MRTFLQDVSHDLYVKLNGDFSRVAIVFPNKRAGLFFNEYLAKESDRPIWAPVYVSISDLMQELSTLKIGDPILLVSTLYQIYKEQTGSEEKLDSFYPWGQLLISDFDDVDKNLVDADRIFENLRDLKDEMDDLSFLDEKQINALEQFFINFSIEKRTELKKKFAYSWNNLNAIYHAYRHKLEEMEIAYEGMLYRSVINRIKSENLHYDKYVFVGFNVLNKVEKSFFSFVRDAGKAMFYWDYDLYYTNKVKDKDKTFVNEAGEFIRTNLQTFGNELSEEYFDHLRKEKKISFISSSSENAQARYLPEWVHETLTGEEKENAVILCNEALLLPVLHSIPNDVKNINITMGFPLSQTPIYNFIKSVFDLQTKGYQNKTGQFLYDNIRIVLSHPYTQRKSEKASSLLYRLTVNNHPYTYPTELQEDHFLTLLFTPQESNLDICHYLLTLLEEIASLYQDHTDNKDDLYNQLYQESIYQCHITINRLSSLIEAHQIEIEANTLNSLLSSILRVTSIPFHGEPIVGMQIMGLLETRNLDFKNLLIMSLNEGQLPKSGNEISFIPYNLRKAFGMTTIEHKNAVYAYYFYRLIQRSEQVTLLYNSATNGLNKGEMSRFMLQLLIEYPHPIQRFYLETDQVPSITQEIIVKKTEHVMKRLIEEFDVSGNPKASILSPSALNHYMDCSLRFYFQHVAKIKIPEEITIEINSPMFGTIFHKAAKLTYDYLGTKKKLIQRSDVDFFLKSPELLQNIIDRAFKEEFFHVKFKEKIQYNGTQLINFKVIETYIKQLLEFDRRYTPFTIIEEEKSIDYIYSIHLQKREFDVRLGGIVDRMDLKDGILRIVDYKTGGTPATISGMDDLFLKEKKRASYVFQVFLYAVIARQRKFAEKIKPTLLYIHKAASDTYSSDILIGNPRQSKEPVEDIAVYEKDFCSSLEILLNKIFDPTIPFSQTTDLDKCKYCDYAKVCRRENY